MYFFLPRIRVFCFLFSLSTRIKKLTQCCDVRTKDSRNEVRRMRVIVEAASAIYFAHCSPLYPMCYFFMLLLFFFLFAWQKRATVYILESFALYLGFFCCRAFEIKAIGEQKVSADHLNVLKCCVSRKKIN